MNAVRATPARPPYQHSSCGARPGVWFAGSTERCSIRDAGEEKSVNLVELAKGRVTPVPLPARPMLDLPALEARGLADAAAPAAVYERLTARPLDGAIARLRVTGLAPHVYSTLDFARVKALYPGRRFGPDGVLATPDRRLRACGLSQAKLLALKDLAAKVLRAVGEMGNKFLIRASGSSSGLRPLGSFASSLEVEPVGPVFVEMTEGSRWRRIPWATPLRPRTGLSRTTN